MMEEAMPKDVAYRMIHDHLSLDGNPMLNLASFVTTYMEKEAEQVWTFKETAADCIAYGRISEQELY
jgi:glutamate/tyrosine decarboxylase-like PLP-dependent enzyme